MGLPTILTYLKNLWPFPTYSYKQDIKISSNLVKKLSLPETTKQFIFAIPNPQTNSVIYLLATQNLSERSALDAELLVTELKPDLVVAHIAPSKLTECRVDSSVVPTSAVGVLKSCFVNKSGKERYESLAGDVVVREIFGVGFYGQFVAAKKAASEVGSRVLFVESCNGHACDREEDEEVGGNGGSGGRGKGFVGVNNNFVPGGGASGRVVSRGGRRLLLNSDDVYSQGLKLLVSNAVKMSWNPKLVSSRVATSSLSASEVRMGMGVEMEDCKLRNDFQAPAFAESVYPLLTDLHDMFSDLPLIGRALGHAQKMLGNVERGENVDSRLLSEVLTFRIAVEGLRVGLNIAGRCPLKKDVGSKGGFVEFSDEDKSNALFTQALRSQTKKYKTVVAIVDASSLAAIRQYWDTSIPREVEDMIDQILIEYGGEEQEEAFLAKSTGRRILLADKSVVAVGAGATAVLGVTSFSKLVHASTFMKVATYNVPVTLKVGLLQTQKAMTFAFAKVLGPSKVLIPGVSTAGVKSSAVMKATASAEKIRAVAHSVIASAERTSFSAMRTAFYEIMRKKRVRPIGPFVTFGCSIATCGGLLTFGDGIECAVESFPVAPKIASLGRGLQSLHEASETVRQKNSGKIQETLQSLMYSLKKKVP